MEHTNIDKARFLSHPRDLGVVAVGFSRGQVRPLSLFPSNTLLPHPLAQMQNPRNPS